MFHLKAAASKRVAAYFSAPKTNHGQFVNKKWNERGNLDESKKTFLKRVVGEWKNATDQERLEFLKAPPPV